MYTSGLPEETDIIKLSHRIFDRYFINIIDDNSNNLVKETEHTTPLYQAPWTPW